MTINLILADDHPALLSGMELGLSEVPGLRVVGKARNSTELLALLATQQCDILFSDYSMPGGSFGDGMGMLSYVRRRYPKIKIIVFTVIDNDAIVFEMMRLGVKSVLNKSESMRQVVAAIQAVHTGGVYAPPLLAREAQAHAESNGLPALSRREVEVLRLYVSGASVTQIARQLNRTKQTVSTQKSSAMQKLGLQRDVDLFRFAYQNGMVQGSDALAVRGSAACVLN
ncbi:DNA-binding response regulator [Bordetella trematum]|nr:response regulator transcription factor [Bordetella trematum]AZR92862.1 DNA-binding response regulator [Bordetella trematum]NNH17926.1 response regulator transcription factor [Bordetella trematum]